MCTCVHRIEYISRRHTDGPSKLRAKLEDVVFAKDIPPSSAEWTPLLPAFANFAHALLLLLAPHLHYFHLLRLFSHYSTDDPHQ